MFVPAMVVEIDKIFHVVMRTNEFNVFLASYDTYSDHLQLLAKYFRSFLNDLQVAKYFRNYN